MAVDIKPNGIWKDAGKETATATVTAEGQPYPNVLIKQFPFTPGKATIRRGSYPNGVIILNENPLPDHRDIIDTTNQFPHFNVVWIDHGQESVEVDITEDLGWPNGVIVLPRKD